jgi:membrane-associated phospholipid phosphatase
MDIEYLLFLQGLRESWSFTGFIAKIFSYIGQLSLLIPAILFWCFNKRAGLFLMFVSSFGRMINILIKDTFCVYRPFILDPAVNPGAEAIKDASSYSMPSGHTQFAAANFGGLAYLYRKIFPKLIIPCVLAILAVAFSRNFLGVHTPQDVLVAILEMAALIFVTDKIFNAIEKDKNLEKTLFGAGIAFCVISAIYILTKSYPVDYLNGEIIVSATDAKLDSMDSIGMALGFLIGVALENKFVNFSTNVDFGVKIRRIIVGGIVGGAAIAVLLVLKFTGLNFVYEFFKGFLPLLTLTFFVPYAFNYLETKTRYRFKKYNP